MTSWRSGRLKQTCLEQQPYTLRRSRSFDSFSDTCELPGLPKIIPSTRSSASRGITEETTVCSSSFQNSEDQLDIVSAAAPTTILEEDHESPRSPGSGRVRVLKRQMCRESSSDTLVDVIAGTAEGEGEEYKPRVSIRINSVDMDTISIATGSEPSTAPCVTLYTREL
eukprot:sb/3472352/